MFGSSLKSISIFLLLQTAQCCAPNDARQAGNDTNSTPEHPYVVRGDDSPADLQTTGYYVNHFSLNVNNLTRSIDFYTRVFGMRFMFTYHLTPHLSFTYVTHSQGGRNGTGYQTNGELIREKNNNGGAIEFVHFTPPNKKDIEGPKVRATTLSHVGMVVPDPKATQERLKQQGVPIYKGVGEDMPTEGPFASPFYLGDATNLSPDDFAAIQAGMTKLNFQNIFAEDPDGNLLEIIPREESISF
ncbi:unnamed protein product [Periconia digitata]|uniref:VOC domain-containing protein n=1 Tax=Periconia digitata TaxID=1303443 RepID=A0A9W4XGR3_9PLEO|nr:unnamed protein product [Periconia digitata]